MEFNEFFPKIINEFKIWFEKDEHSKREDFYRHVITYDILKNYDDEKFVEFFYNFVKEGGKIQSGGERTKDRFKEYLTDNVQKFRAFVLEPFNQNFDLEKWFNGLENHKYFGTGIATIYLNRIDKNKFSILNNKTLNALRLLGYSISQSKSYKNYISVNNWQAEWIKNYSYLYIDNFYKADSINHFLIATDEGKALVNKYILLEEVYDAFEQEELVELFDDEKSIDYNKLYKDIMDLEKDTQEYITFNSKRYKRSNYLMAKIKKYRESKCQFCTETILKENGSYYIEACHITPKAQGGKDSLDNVLVLCPNCHKRFDYGKKEDEIRTKEVYSVKLNGKLYEVSLKQ